MGNCATQDQPCAATKIEAAAAVEDQAAPESDSQPVPANLGLIDPAPITVDLVMPEVDVSAPLDDRDIQLVQQTFARVALLGAENVGWVVFMNIFKLAPEARGLFKFDDHEDVAKSAKMKTHAGKVVRTVATAVSLLRDLDTLVPVLQQLGTQHVLYGVIPAHYDVVGEALILSLQSALGKKMTPAVTNAYLKVYTIVKTTMCGDHYPTSPPEEQHPAPEAEAEAEAAAKAADEAAKKEAEAAAEQKAAEQKAAEQKAAEQKRAEAKKKAMAKKPVKRINSLEAKKARQDAWAAFPQAKKDELASQLFRNAVTGDTAKTKAILEASCDPDAEAEGQTALQCAAAKGNTAIVKLLVDYGADVTKKATGTGVEGLTALHMACQKGHKEVVPLVYSLKAMGKDNALKKSPMMIAEEGGHTAVVDALKKLKAAK